VSTESTTAKTIPAAEPKRTRDTELGRLRGQVRRERTHAKMAKRHAMDCDASQAEAEAAQVRAEARHTNLKAKHLRAVADHEHEIDALADRAEQAEADVAESREEVRLALDALRKGATANADEILADLLETLGGGER
jgi:molecular chaperone GrpE (heat shock protein)